MFGSFKNDHIVEFGKNRGGLCSVFSGFVLDENHSSWHVQMVPCFIETGLVLGFLWERKQLTCILYVTGHEEVSGVLVDLY